MTLPPALVQKLREVHDHADPWLDELAALIEKLEEQWNVRVTGLVDELSYHVVAFAEAADGTPYILKMGPPNPESLQEIRALEYYDGDGICCLIAAEPEAVAMLLERVQPGVSLWKVEDDELATHACADLLSQLWRPVEDASNFRSLESWTSARPEHFERYPQSGPLS